MIRLANNTDIEILLDIYKKAREFMRANGNLTQWPDTYPNADVLRDDIKKGELFVFEENGRVHGVFAFILGNDPTYDVIEDGAWLSDSAYGTIHRIASDGSIKGLFDQCISYCKQSINHLRIDTHQYNKTMQYVIKKNGFQYCGIIYTDNGSPRVAFEYLP